MFDFRLFWRLAVRSFSRRANAVSPLTQRRVGFLILFYLIWPPLAAFTWLGLLLDDVLFPGYKRQPVEKPLFILSNFRSGSTFVQRALARDSATFTSMRTSDVVLTPSITQRKLVRALARLDALCGGPLMKMVRWFDATMLGRVKIHPISLFEPEEDELVLMYAWSSFFVAFLFPFLDELPPYQFFDSAIPRADRERIMGFYRTCVQRHLYATCRAKRGSASDINGATGSTHYFVSKNPAFSPKIETLLALFPDARILYLVRNPLQTLPSTVSWLSYAWHQTGNPAQKYPYCEEILALARYWYDHPLAVIDREASPRHMILRYEDLMAQPEATLREVCSRFGYPQDDAFERALRESAAEARRHVSAHAYNYEEMGFTREQIVREFAAVFERFAFDTRESYEHPSAFVPAARH